MEFASVDKVVDIGGVSTIVLFGLLLTFPAEEEPYAEYDGCETQDTDHHTHCDADRVG